MSDKRIEITCWRSGRVLFAHEAEHNTMRLTVEAAVKAGVNLSGADLRDANLYGADLRGAYLGGAYLGGADLSSAYLGGAHLSGANLGSADLRDAYLEGADLDSAHLSGADLYGAYLGGADLRHAHLDGADLRDAYLSGADLRGADLRDAYLRGANLVGADLRGAYLGGAYLGGADGEEITLVGRRPILQIGPIGPDWGTLIAYLTDQGIYLSLGRFFGTREQFAAAMLNDNIHASEYAAALSLIDAHERLWMPDEEASNAAIAKTIGQEGEQ